VANRFVPVLAGAALRNRGVQPMLDAIIDFLPSPLDKLGVEGINAKSNVTEWRKPADNQPFAALAFKIATDPYVGKLTFFRVYAGTLKSGSYVWNATRGTNEETAQTIISGMGELHLEIIVDRMLREFAVDANVGKPQVAYRETIKRKAHGVGRFIRQSGGRGQYGHAEINIEPNEADKGFE